MKYLPIDVAASSNSSSRYSDRGVVGGAARPTIPMTQGPRRDSVWRRLDVADLHELAAAGGQTERRSRPASRPRIATSG